MKKAIYKIENKINHKVYIGQSKNPKHRWQEHIHKREGYTSLIHTAIEKYGIDNFEFSIIGWFEDYNEKEQEYIAFYRSLAPYGYNIQTGGEEPPHPSGENHPMAKITNEEVQAIIKDLLDWKIPQKTIISNHKITADMLRHIKEGSSWHQDNLTYPLRPDEKQLNEYRALYIQWMCCSSNVPLNQLGALVGWNRSSAKMINQGKNHFRDDLVYPLRNNAEENKKILSQEICIDYLRFGE